MKNFLLILAATTLFPFLSEAREIMRFATMAGVDGPFVNNSSIRGVLGDELPWEIGRGAWGFLTEGGHLFIHVKGLVFTNDPSVPPELRGINDETKFRALVSCLADDGHGAIATFNMMTQGFPATRKGNSTINAWVTLPKGCTAPIIFVMSGEENKWFAVTGAEE